MIKHSEEFKREAVRIALTSGLPGRAASTNMSPPDCAAAMIAERGADPAVLRQYRQQWRATGAADE